MRVVASEGVQLLYSVSITCLPFDLCPRVRPVRLPPTLCGGATAKAVVLRSCLAPVQVLVRPVLGQKVLDLVVNGDP